MSTAPLQYEQKLQELCQQAMSEQDPMKLLKVFLELDQAVERKQGQSRSAMPRENAFGSDFRHSQT